PITGKRAFKKGANRDMRKAAFDQIVTNHGINRACILSGYPKSSHYYKPMQRTKVQHLDLDVLRAIEKEVLQHPSYGIRRVRAMLQRSGIAVNRKKVYRIMKLANLVRKRNVRKHVIVKRMLTVPERPDHLWQQDI